MKWTKWMLLALAIGAFAGCGEQAADAPEAEDGGSSEELAAAAEAAIAAYEGRLANAGQIGLEAYLEKIDFREERLDEVVRGVLDWSPLDPYLMRVPEMIGLSEDASLAELQELLDAQRVAFARLRAPLITEEAYASERQLLTAFLPVGDHVELSPERLALDWEHLKGFAGAGGRSAESASSLDADSRILMRRIETMGLNEIADTIAMFEQEFEEAVRRADLFSGSGGAAEEKAVAHLEWSQAKLRPFIQVMFKFQAAMRERSDPNIAIERWETYYDGQGEALREMIDAHFYHRQPVGVDGSFMVATKERARLLIRVQIRGWDVYFQPSEETFLRFEEAFEQREMVSHQLRVQNIQLRVDQRYVLGGFELSHAVAKDASGAPLVYTPEPFYCLELKDPQRGLKLVASVPAGIYHEVTEGGFLEADALASLVVLQDPPERDLVPRGFLRFAHSGEQ